jgi:hypothetical protein
VGLIGITSALAALLTGASSAATAADPEREALLSAAVVYNIARFSAWPDEAGADGAFDVCVERRSDAARAFETIAGKDVGGLPVRVVQVDPDGAALPQCEVVFIERSRGYDEDLRLLAGPGTLTVGRAADFLERGGAVRLTIDGKPRFAVHIGTARKAGVKPSAKLLSLAEEVVR